MNIKKIAKERNIDARKLSTDLDISYTYANYILRSNRPPSLKIIKKMRSVYNIPLGSC
jgi:transcriptional regulator with XRE-family HTH domain